MQDDDLEHLTRVIARLEQKARESSDADPLLLRRLERLRHQREALRHYLHRGDAP